jgi:hypothetical protein
VLALVAAALLLPALVATVDGFARARRRRLAIAPWLGWMAVWILPFVVGLAVAELLSLVGATPEPPTAPVPPSEHPLDAAAIGVLVGVTAGAALAWWGARRLLVEGRPELGDRAAPGAGVALALVALGTIALLWVVNPYAGLVMALAAHLWMLAALSDPPPPRRGRLALVALGVLPPLLVALYYLVALSVDPLTGAWYLLLLVTGGAVGLPTALLGCALLGSVGAAFEVARSARAEEAHPDERPPVYGPGAHAGPGSLGGTESALRR